MQVASITGTKDKYYPGSKKSNKLNLNLKQEPKKSMDLEYKIMAMIKGFNVYITKEKTLNIATTDEH